MIVLRSSTRIPSSGGLVDSCDIGSRPLVVAVIRCHRRRACKIAKFVSLHSDIPNQSAPSDVLSRAARASATANSESRNTSIPSLDFTNRHALLVSGLRVFGGRRVRALSVCMLRTVVDSRAHELAPRRHRPGATTPACGRHHRLQRRRQVLPAQAGESSPPATSPSPSSEGEIVSIVGPSGCGKTTMLNLVAGLMKPTTARCVYRGERDRRASMAAPAT